MGYKMGYKKIYGLDMRQDIKQYERRQYIRNKIWDKIWDKKLYDIGLNTIQDERLNTRCDMGKIWIRQYMR